MSRSGYVDGDELEQWGLIRWRGAVKSAIRGKRGQAFFKEMLAALDAMPDKRLVAAELQIDGEVCAMGAVARARGIDVAEVDPEDPEAVAQTFSVAPTLVREIAFRNDEAAPYREQSTGRYTQDETPEERWQRMRHWVQSQIKVPV